MFSEAMVGCYWDWVNVYLGWEWKKMPKSKLYSVFWGTFFGISKHAIAPFVLLHLFYKYFKNISKQSSKWLKLSGYSIAAKFENNEL